MNRPRPRGVGFRLGIEEAVVDALFRAETTLEILRRHGRLANR